MARRDVINAAMRLARQAGGRAEERPKSPVPDYLLQQQREGIPNAGDTNPAPGRRVLDALGELGGIAGEMTGVPSVYRGAKTMGEDGASNKIKGAAEIASGVLPGLGMTKAAAPLFRTLPRTIATMSAPGAANALADFIPSANAADKPRSPALMTQIQERLAAKGIYRGKIDGLDGQATRDAEEQEKAIEAKADAERQLQLRKLDGENSANEAVKARAAADTAKNNQDAEAKKRADDAAALAREDQIKGLKKADESNKADWVTPALQFGAPAAGALIGGALGKWGFAGPIASRVEAGRRAAQQRADAIISGAGRETRDMAARVNQFYTEGGGSDPFKIANTKTGWVSPVANKNVPPASALYPKPSNAGEWAASAGFAAPGIGEAGWAQKNYMDAVAEKREAEKALSARADEASILRLQDAKREVAKWDGLRLLGIGEATGTLGTTFAKMRTRPDFRPDVHAAENMRAKVGQNVQAEKAKAAAQSAGQPPAPARNPPKPKKQPNGGAAPLVPLAMLPGASGQREQAGEERDALPDSDERFQRGGTVGQAMRIAKQSGGAADSSSGNPQKERAGPPYKLNRPSYVIPAWFGLVDGMAKAVGKKAFGLPPDPNLIDLQAGRPAYQSGGAVIHAGPIKHDAAGGRTDTVPLDVASGSYVIPADIISGIGQGDTTSGYHKLTQMFGPQAPKPAQASGAPSVPILAAGGEFVISPEAVGRVGKGDLKAGHEALDLWVRMQRRKTIQELKKLPGPSRD